jgi:erythromycin esterase-like protein
MTKFLPAWMRNDFHSTTGQPIKNKDMIVHLLALLNQRSQDNKVKFWHVKAHVGETGNEGADVSRILTIGTVIPGQTLIPRPVSRLRKIGLGEYRGRDTGHSS